MKKIFFLLAPVSFALLLSCNNSGDKPELKSDDMSQKNRAAVNAINKSIETGDVSKIEDAIAKDAIDHGAQGDIKGVDSIKKVLAGFHSMADSMKTEVVHEWADNEFVCQWLKFSGISKSPEMGPVGAHFIMTAIELVKCKDSKVTEHWEFMQAADMMKMMPPPPPVKSLGK